VALQPHVGRCGRISRTKDSRLLRQHVCQASDGMRYVVAVLIMRASADGYLSQTAFALVSRDVTVNFDLAKFYRYFGQ
jgi:hypothetical protein